MSDLQPVAAGRPSCLVLMPMYAGFEDIRASVARALPRGGFEMARLEVEIEDSAWHLWLLDALDRCDVALVDLTDHNPFVTYELGCVHQRQLPVAFMVSTRERRLPATVRGAVCTPYGDGCDRFEDDIVHHLQQLVCARMRVQDDARSSPAASSSEIYRAAIAAAAELSAALRQNFMSVGEADFHIRLTVARRRGAPDPRALAGELGRRYLLSLVLAESDRLDVMRAIGNWCHERESREKAI